jgi:hypothetical protein
VAERSFAEPVKATEIHESIQRIKPDKWEKHDLTLMLVGATLGCMVTILFMGGMLLVIGGK